MSLCVTLFFPPVPFFGTTAPHFGTRGGDGKGGGWVSLSGGSGSHWGGDH